MCIFLIFIFGCVYALPNLYKENFLVTIASYIESDQNIDNNLLCDIKKVLEEKKIFSKSILFEKNQIQIYFFSETDQLHAYEILDTFLLKKYLVSYKKVSSMPKWLCLIQAQPITLGLDLKGGLYLIIKVDIDTTLKRFQKQYVDAVQSILNEKMISYTRIHNIKNYGIEIDFKSLFDKNQAVLCLSKIYHHNTLLFNSINDCTLCLNFSKNYIFSICENAMKKNSDMLRHRMNQLKIFDPIIQRYGNDYIIVELPGIHDANKIKKVFSSIANLELRLVNINVNKFKINNNFIPEDSEIKLDKNGNIVLLYKKIILTGDHIIDSNISFDEYHRPQVNIFLDNLGSSMLSKFTKDNVGKLMATLFIEYKDTGKKNSQGYPILYRTDTVINIASIQTQLSHNFCISGIDNVNEAQYLSELLRMGSLASPMYIEKECIVGPTLGKQNITRGIVACGLGVLVSILFMFIWYRCFGLIAGVALIMNLILIISIMSLIPGFMLTMSSIAGIVLTLSVAIDSNVLINERIKEEIRLGKPIQYSIHEGYRKAFVTIVDSNITTVITSVVLYIMSTGSIQGFAMTTMIGVGTSMFTSIVGTRTFVNLFYGKRRINKLSI